MDCILTINYPGRGKITRPLRNFIRNDEVYYKNIKNHCKTCTQCSSEEILQAFLKLRKTPKFQGRISQGLCMFAITLNRIRPANPETVREFILKTNSFGIFAAYVESFTEFEILKALRCKFTQESILNKLIKLNRLKKSDKLEFVKNALILYKDQSIPENDEEALREIICFSVMNS